MRNGIIGFLAAMTTMAALPASAGDADHLQILVDRQDRHHLAAIAEKAPQNLLLLVGGVPIREPGGDGGEYHAEVASGLAIGPRHARRLAERTDGVRGNDESYRSFGQRLEAGVDLDTERLEEGAIVTRARVGRAAEGRLVVDIESVREATPAPDAQAKAIGPVTRLRLRPVAGEDYAIEDVEFLRRGS